ncbi:MAG: type VII secretion protein EssC [Ruminococcus sp.]|nr:type VII secretion protein EssC [Ruminococcus sp.]
MNYKLTIFGNNVYREIELSEDMTEEMLIGTTPACQVRFNREHFFDDFEIRLEKNGSEIRLGCQQNIYFATEYMLKEYMVVLKNGDSVHINYDSTDSELFRIELMFDYDRELKSFDYCMDISGYSQLYIGGAGQCQIILTDDIIGNDYICLSRYGNMYHVDASYSRYGVYVNGFKAEERAVDIKDGDFFALVGHLFYVSGGRIYIRDPQYIRTSLQLMKLNSSANALEYPKFKRNTRQKYVVPSEEIEVLQPKSLSEEPKKNLAMVLIPSLASLVLMVLLRGVMGGGGMFVIYSVAMMAMGVITSIWTYMNDGKEYKEKKKQREEKYNSYIAMQENKIQGLREKESAILRQKYLSVGEDVALVERFDSRLFERSAADDDFLEVYLGTGTKKAECKVKFKKQEYKDTEDEMADYPMYLHDRYEYLENVPISVNLRENPVIGVTGQRGKLYQMLKNMVLDLAARHFYSDVKMYFIMEEKDTPQFEWMRWLRHAYDARTDSRTFMYDEDSEKFVLEFLYGELSRREMLSKEEKPLQEQYVIFVYRSEALLLHPVARYIGRKDLGFTFIFFEEHPELLHNGCKQVIYLDANANQGCIVLSEDGDKQQSFVYEHISSERAGAFAKRLGCVYVDEVSLEGNLTKNISLYELMHIMSADDINLRKRWATSRIYETMAAPLGVKSGNEVVYLDLHEKYHGPHGLVAGTTGSGKSEILQSYILSMATLFHPYEVGFVIIDFKGGGMVNQFRDLPHLNGAITNIDGREIERSLLSIRAELRKRQELFAKYNVNHIDAYIKKYKAGETDKPLPHLILIVDEFAELKSDQPEFMKELISTARIGRSLGVHLILATQKPSGVVDNQIWSNSKFKLCLKVQNKEDSTEVLKSPLAAEIKEPGRAYLQVGNNEIFQLFQSAYSGAQASVDIDGNQKKYKISKVSLSGKRQVIYEKKNKSSKEGKTQLEAIVEYVAKYCQENHIEKLPNICLPPLEEKIPYPSGVLKYKDGDIRVPVGIYDDPDHQIQDVTGVNFTQSNIFILGSSLYGKTNLLQVMIKGLAANYSPEDVNIYIIDFASMFLKNYEKLAHVGGVIISSEDEKLKTFMKMMAAEIKERKEKLLSLGLSSFASYREAGYKEIPQIVLMIDNLTALKELYPQYEEILLHLCREGISVGLSVVAANLQSSGVGYKYFSNFAKRIALYCNDSSEYGYIFESCRMRPKNVPGRCLVDIDKTIFDMQVYQAFAEEKEAERSKAAAKFIEEINAKHKGRMAKKIPEIPKVLTDAYISTQFANAEREPYEIYLGLNFATTELMKLAVAQQGVMGMVGRPHGGKTNFVNYLLHSLSMRGEEEPLEIYIMDGIEKKLQRWKENPYVVNYSMNPQDACTVILNIEKELEKRYQMMVEEREEELSRQPLLLVVLQNKDAVTAVSADRGALEAFKRIQTKYKSLRVSILLTNLDNAPIGFSSPEAVKVLKDSKNLMIFENISEQKVHDVPLAQVREFAKPLEAGEAYRVVGSQLTKVKTVLLRQ